MPDSSAFTSEQSKVDTPEYSPSLRLIGVASAGAVAMAAHHRLLRDNPNYGLNLFRWASKFEEITPFGIGRTFALSDRFSSYLADNLHFSRRMLANGTGLTETGEHFQRLFGDRLNVLRDAQAGLTFKRAETGSPYLRMAGKEGIAVRFTESGGRLAGSSYRYHQPRYEKTSNRSTKPTLLGRAWESYQEFRKAQVPRNYTGGAAVDSARMAFLPFHAEFDGGVAQKLRNLQSRVSTNLFEIFERPQRLFADVGIGLKQGQYNKILHVPFVGEGGLVNNLLTKRVLPVIAGVTALRYLDYRLGHHPENFIVDTALKANILRADLTDMVPGARTITDFYNQVVPGPQYGPLALPLAGAFAGGLYHYGRVLGGRVVGSQARELGAKLLPDVKVLKGATSIRGLKALWRDVGHPGKGALLGLAAMLPFVPGMLESRKTGSELRRVYSGEEPVAVRAGRGWDMGSTPYAGARIKEYRPHAALLFKARAEIKSFYGSEEEYWAHNPLLHPIRYLRDPYYLEKLHYRDRPYPVTSPAFSDVPLVGPLLAATIGKLVKPVTRMHEQEWQGDRYSLYSTRLEPRGPEALPPPKPQEEYSVSHALRQEAGIFAEFTGLPGFIAASIHNAIFPDANKGRKVYFQGSRQMTNVSRQYYERELGAGLGPNPGGQLSAFGYSEPLRRFVQREGWEPQANDIPNTMPSWMPGEDYFTNFRVGDPYVKISNGYARLPGKGYEAVHPELEGLSPEAYPDIEKLKILADVAPYSREFSTFKGLVGKQAEGNTELEIEYEKILERAQNIKDSVINTAERRFTAATDEKVGTIASASPYGFYLKEYPGRVFQFSSVGMTAADMSAAILAEHNDFNRSQVAREVESRRSKLADYVSDVLRPGARVHVTVARGATEHAERIRAVVETDRENINLALIDQGYGIFREHRGGPETSAMYGRFSRTIGAMAESLAFTGDNSPVNPLRYVPSPAHTKLWQERTALSQYVSQELVGTRMRRWHRPIHDFVGPYLRGVAERLTGVKPMPDDIRFRRDLNTLADVLTYLRGVDKGGKYGRQGSRTSIGANQLSSVSFIASTLPDRDAHYFRRFVTETDPDMRAEILDIVPTEMQRALESQWTAQDERIAAAEGASPAPVGEQGRLYTDEDLAKYHKANTKLGYGDYLRSQEITNFFSRTGFALPEEGSAALDESLDYEDVKLKIIRQEGYDAHDFNIFDDRASLLWRKPYVDGAVRELTSGKNRSADQLRRACEQMMLASRNYNADIRTVTSPAFRDRGNVRINVDVDQEAQILADMRRNPERFDIMSDLRDLT